MKNILKSLLLIVLMGCGSPPFAAVSSLPDPLSEKLASLTNQADHLLDQGRFLEAAGTYQQALDLLPKPLNQWSACAWLTISLGDSFYFAGDYESAQAALMQAMECPGAQSNPYAHLRMGQVQLELGQCEQAANALTYALVNAGYEIFEDEPPRYLDFAASLLSLQAGSSGILQC